MKLHDLRPAEGSHKARTRVGRGIAAGKGKTAGRGTKGQKARAGASIPPWFEGGQTPLHQRIPKLRGFTNRAKVQFEVVNVGAIAQRVGAGAFTQAGTTPKKGEQLTINADILRAVGLVRDVRKPLKILGAGELSAALFVVADAFTKSATQKIEAVASPPPEKRSSSPSSWLELNRLASWAWLTLGTGTFVRTRKMSRIPRVKRILRRISGARMAVTTESIT